MASKDDNNHKDNWISLNRSTIHTNELDQALSESWKRSKIALNGDEHCRAISPEKHIWEEIINTNTDLKHAAKVVIAQVFPMVKDYIDIIILTDTTGVIMEIAGQSEILIPLEKEVSLLEGYNFSEVTVGTTALGLAIIDHKPHKVNGTEHFCRALRNFTTSAMPIVDDTDTIIGYLCFFQSDDTPRKNPMETLETTTLFIQKQFELDESSNLIDSLLEGSKELIVCDKGFVVRRVTYSAETMLKIKATDLLFKDIRDFFNDIDFRRILGKNLGTSYSEHLFSFQGNHTKVFLSISPIIIHDFKTVGYMISMRHDEFNEENANTINSNYLFHFEDIITNNPKMLKTIDYARRMATTSCSILLEGESGTGKELFAQSIHNASNRAMGPFVAINCASLPKELVESELFGYEKGTFTGALTKGKKGKFEIADKGTIFLDEVGELPLETQSKLLRFLDNSLITRIGSEAEKKVDVRVIAATNRSLTEIVEQGYFRADLFYRLNVISITLPSLNERADDIEHLVSHFVKKMNKENGIQKSVNSEFTDAMKRAVWKGNVRELQNAVARAYYYSDGNVLGVEDLPQKMELAPATSIFQADVGIRPIKDIEREAILASIAEAGGNIPEAARKLKMSKSTIYRKIEKYGIKINELKND